MTQARVRVHAELSKLARRLRELDDFLVVGHVDPDLDSIGSTLALALALKALGKRCEAASPDPPPRAWAFLPGFDRLLVGDAAATWSGRVAVVVDTEVSPGRLGAVWPVVCGARLRFNVDHHDTNDLRADMAVVEPACAATGELVYHLIRHLGAPLSREVAINLYVAILTDTGSFHFSSTRPETFRIAAELVEAGADPHELAMRVYDTRPWPYMRLLGDVLSAMQRSDDGRIAWLVLPRALVQTAGLSPSEVEGLVQYPRMVEGVEVAILFKEIDPNTTRVSLRSQRYVDVAAIARRFGGGGHLRAAGCTLSVPVAQAVEQVVRATAEAVSQTVPVSSDGWSEPPESGEKGSSRPGQGGGRP